MVTKHICSVDYYLRYLRVEFKSLKTKLKNCQFIYQTTFQISTIIISMFLCHSFVWSSQIDHIGPDPIQSEHCIVITPGHSISCNGKQEHPMSLFTPNVVINCNPGLFILLTHQPIPVRSSMREVTIAVEDEKLSESWLAISNTQSAILLFDDGINSFNYYWFLRLVGRLLSPTVSTFDYSIDFDSLVGYFRLDTSDRHLLHQLTTNCG